MIQEGQVFDNTYRLTRFIGEGGMGRVYEATHARLAGRYAIKVLLQKLSSNSDALTRFNREARITSSLQHPNIVQVIDFNTAEDGTEYLVMEYLHGESLAARLGRLGPMSVEAVVGVVDQVAAGLAAAHAHGIVHRDLKPENIFLLPIEGRDTEWAKVLDFGISKMTDGNRGPGGPVSALVGTPLYMAPEQCQGRTRDVDATTDQFALAVITYEMLTGKPPFAGDNIGDILSRVIYKDPPPMTIGGEIEQVVRRGMAKANAERFPSVTAFAEALRTAAANRVRENRVREKPDTGTNTFAVGEIAQPRLAGRSNGRNWGIVMVAAVTLAVTTALLVRQARDRRLGAPASATAAPTSHPAPVGRPAQVNGPPSAPQVPSLNAETPQPESASAPARGQRGSTEAPGRSAAATATTDNLAPNSANSIKARSNTEVTRARPRVADRETVVPRPSRAQPFVRNSTVEPDTQPPPVPVRVVPHRAIADEDATLPLDEKIGDRPAF